MARTFPGLTFGKNFVYLSGLFSLALLLFSSAGVYAQDIDAPVEPKHAESTAPTFTNTEISQKTNAENTVPALEPKSSLSGENMSVEDDARFEWIKTRYIANHMSDYKRILGAKKTLPETRTIPLDFMIPEIPNRCASKSPSPLSLLLCHIRNSSPQINLLDAATRKLSADNPDNKKLRSSFLDIKREYDATITDLAKIYVRNEANPNADKSLNSLIWNEVGKGDDYFSERFLLELGKQKNHISDTEYQSRKIEIDDRYAGKYMLAAANLSPNDVAALIVELAPVVHTMHELVSELAKAEPVVKWLTLMALITFPFLNNRYQWKMLEINQKTLEGNQKILELGLKKDRREEKEFELLELKKRQLENINIQLELQIEEQRNKLAKQSGQKRKPRKDTKQHELESII